MAKKKKPVDAKQFPNEALFSKEKEAFIRGRDHLHAEIASFSKVAKKTSLLAAFFVWAKEYTMQSLLEDNIALLVKNEFIDFKNKSGDFVKIQDVNEKSIKSDLEKIRCRKELTIAQQELLVQNFIDFFNWLANQTLFYHLKIADPDKSQSQNRVFAHEDFIDLLTHLDKRCQLIAKLLYFGGRRTLDEVITLHIEVVDFKNYLINYEDQPVSYPLHVFEDIKSLIGDRTSGNLFIGRQGTPINPSTIFRNFKEVANLLDFEETFSPKTLTTDLFSQ